MADILQFKLPFIIFKIELILKAPVDLIRLGKLLGESMTSNGGLEEHEIDQTMLAMACFFCMISMYLLCFPWAMPTMGWTCLSPVGLSSSGWVC